MTCELLQSSDLVKSSDLLSESILDRHLNIDM